MRSSPLWKPSLHPYESSRAARIERTVNRQLLLSYIIVSWCAKLNNIVRENRVFPCQAEQTRRRAGDCMRRPTARAPGGKRSPCSAAFPGGTSKAADEFFLAHAGARRLSLTSSDCRFCSSRPAVSEDDRGWVEGRPAPSWPRHWRSAGRPTGLAPTRSQSRLLASDVGRTASRPVFEGNTGIVSGAVRLRTRSMKARMPAAVCLWRG